MTVIDELQQLLERMIMPELGTIKVRFELIDKQFDGLGKQLDYLIGRIDRIEADLREFYRVMGIHEARLDNLEKS